MTEITKSITYLKEYRELKKALEAGQTPALAVGLSPIHKAHLAAALGLDTGRPVLVLTDDDSAAARFSADLQGFAEKPVLQLPARDLVMADVAGVSRGYEHRGSPCSMRCRARGLRSRPCRPRRSAPCRPPRSRARS